VYDECPRRAFLLYIALDTVAGASRNKMYWPLMTKKTQFSLRFTTGVQQGRRRRDYAACLPPRLSVCRMHGKANSARYQSTGQRRFILPETNRATIYLVGRFAELQTRN